MCSAPHGLEGQQTVSEHAVLEILSQQGWRAVELARQRDRDLWLRREPVFQGLWLRDPGAADSSVFDFFPYASAPRTRDGMALAYDQGTGPRMWSGFTETDPSRTAALGAAARAARLLWRLLPPINGGPRDVLGPSRCPGARFRVGMEVPFGFGTNGRDAPPDAHALIVYADCQRELGSGWHIGAGLRGYAWRSPTASDREDVETSLRLAHIPSAEGLVVLLDGSWTPQYKRAVLHVERPLALGPVRLRPFARLGWGEELPFSLGFWPGGYDGFPGLRTGERRGDREVTAALDIQRPLAGRLSVRTLFAVGQTTLGGRIFPGGPWLLGARTGLNLDTRYGLVRVEYGWATHDHRAWLIRAGRFF